MAGDDASIPDAMCGDERRFGTGVGLSLLFRTSSRFDSHFQTKTSLITRNVRLGSKADVDPPTANGPLSPQERTLGLGMSAFRGKADVNHGQAKGPLIAISGHSDKLVFWECPPTI